jgi:protein TonB
MRKVYQRSEPRSRLAVAVLSSLGMTALVFALIPFSHRIAAPARVLEIRKASLTDLPPPVEEELPPPPPEAPPDDVPPPPPAEDAPPPIALVADLDIAVGEGGFLPGFAMAQASAAADLDENMDSFDVSDLEQRPEIIAQVAPAYPGELRRARIEGTVTVVFLLTEEGRVDEARVENASRPEFEAPALDAVRRWKFKPGMKDGEPVRTHMRLPIRFRIASS